MLTVINLVIYKKYLLNYQSSIFFILCVQYIKCKYLDFNVHIFESIFKINLFLISNECLYQLIECLKIC